MTFRTLATLLCSVFVLTAVVSGQRRDLFSGSFDDPAIGYTTAPTTDPIAALNRRLQDGTAQLSFDPASGYLRSVLDLLDIPRESQTLVFSKTSFQASMITMQNPRALYFADDVWVGWVRGADMLELAALDPRQGVIFYTIPQEPMERPRFTRDNQCLQCHLAFETQSVPGLLLTSTFPMANETSAYANGFTNDHRSPFPERWGGWFVTGDTGGVRHMGNVPIMPSDRARTKMTDPLGVHESLAGVLDLDGYLSPYSDVAALMVFAHQARAVNLIVRAGWEARLAERGSAEAKARLSEATSDLADYLLFVDEVPPERPMRSTSGFAERFARIGPHDRRGRSLRQLDLTSRLMRYPASYMIYSDAFDSLPAAARDAVYARIWEVLSGRDRARKYAHLSPADRAAVVEILRETKQNLPSYFQAAAPTVQ